MGQNANKGYSKPFFSSSIDSKWEALNLHVPTSFHLQFIFTPRPKTVEILIHAAALIHIQVLHFIHDNKIFLMKK